MGRVSLAMIRREVGRVLCILVCVVGLAACHQDDKEDRKTVTDPCLIPGSCDVCVSGPCPDLVVGEFSVAPSAFDPDDVITLNGTVKNQGNADAIPAQGTPLRITFAVTGNTWPSAPQEIPLFYATIADPIPPGGEVPFSYATTLQGSYSGRWGNYCTSSDCVTPEVGTVVARVDTENAIAEIDEGNNSRNAQVQVVGVLITATFLDCDFGMEGSSSGCSLSMNDGWDTSEDLRPCSSCQATRTMFANELSWDVVARVNLYGCTNNTVPGGTCTGSWRLDAFTQKPGLPPNVHSTTGICTLSYGQGPSNYCHVFLTLRDPGY